MTQDRLYSVDEVADLLNLHVKTVRRYVREGRLKATRIGKQYRVAAADLETFTGRPVRPLARESAARVRSTDVTTIVRVDAADPETVRRIGALLGAAIVTPADDGSPLRVETVYDEQAATLKLILLGGLDRVATALRVVGAILEEQS